MDRSCFFSTRVAFHAAAFVFCLITTSIAHAQLEEVIVTASPLRTNPLETAQPTSVLAADELRRALTASLGETVARLPGVSSTYYGPVASRPVIRGLSGYRVQILDDGIGSLDVSSLSEDHAASIESGLARQIEVLKGPAALLFGSGGAGGAVNVVSNRLPERLPNTTNGPVSGALELRGDSALDERTAVGEVSAVSSKFVWHLDGYKRETDNVRIPGFARSAALRAEATAEPDEPRDRAPNSGSNSWGAAAGVTYLGEAGSLGLSYSRFNSNYGLAAEPTAFIDMKQNRFDVKGRLNFAVGRFSGITFRGAYNDYTHTEFENVGVPGTLFKNKAYELRVAADHSIGEGWRGVIGVQALHQDFQAFGEEAFVPLSITKTTGLFVYEERRFDVWTLEAGARLDQQKINPIVSSGRPNYDANATNVSLGATWRFAADNALSVNLTRTQRHPQATELYADGVHGALGRIEIGDENIKKETGYTIDAGIRRTGAGINWHVGTFYNRYSDFIYITPTGTTNAEDGLPIFAYRQQDADLYGGEAEVSAPLPRIAGGDLTLRLTADYLRAKLKRDGDLPAIPPLRFGAALDYDRGALHWGLEATQHNKQSDVAFAELPTDGFVMLDVDASYRWRSSAGNVLLFLKGSNLLDKEARQHASPLKDIIPLPGRGLRVGVRLQF